MIQIVSSISLAINKTVIVYSYIGGKAMSYYYKSSFPVCTMITTCVTNENRNIIVVFYLPIMPMPQVVSVTGTKFLCSLCI